MKECTRCHNVLSLSCFTMQRRSPDGYQDRCRDCRNEVARFNYAQKYHGHPAPRENPVRSWKAVDPEIKRLKTYHLSEQDFKALMTLQNEVCAICRGELPASGSGLGQIDHDHACCSSGARSCGKCVRGILCQRCNTGLGAFLDSPARLASAIDYLVNPPFSQIP